MAKGSDKLGSGFDIGETGALSGLLADEDELDSRALWRLGTWAVVSVGAVIVALVTNQSSIGLRREQTASADLLRQTQLAARETQGEARRLASAIETLNGDRDRLYSRVAVLEQGFDSVTGAIARQNSTPAPSSSQASASPAAPSPAAASLAAASLAAASLAAASPATPAAATAAGPAAAAASSSAAPAASAAPASSAAPVATALVDPPPAATKPSPAPVVAPVAATAAAVPDKPAPAPAVSEPSPTVASIPPQKPAAAQPSGSLMASKSMMAPPDPAAGKLIEAAVPPKTVTSAPMPEVAAVTPPAHGEAEPGTSSATPELVVKRTEFGVDVGGANSIPGLRALWYGLLKSRANAALTTLRPIIVIKESGNGLGMQLRLVAGPINDAAAAAKICASLTVNDRSCTTAVFEGQRLAMGSDEPSKSDTQTASDTKPASDANPKPASRGAYRRHYAAKPAPKEEPPKPEPPSAMSLLFGKR